MKVVSTPTFIVGIWRGGSSVSIYVQECLQFLGIEATHLYPHVLCRITKLQKSVDDPSSIRVHGLQYFLEMNRMIIYRGDDVFNSDRNVVVSQSFGKSSG